MKESQLILKLKCPGAPLKRRKMIFTPNPNKYIKFPKTPAKRKINRIYGDLISVKKKLFF